MFPTTVFILAPYLGLILPVAILESNPQLNLIVGLLGLALLGSLPAEALLLPFRLHPEQSLIHHAPSNRALRVVAAVVLTVGLASRVAFIATGGGSLLSQLTGQQGSAITSVAALFSSWNLFAVGLLFACAKRGACRRLTLWGCIGAIAVVELWGALQTTITAPLVQFVSATALAALVLGFVRLRTLTIALIVVLLAWPTFYSLRNALRVEMGAAVDPTVSAFDRLRFDEQLTAVSQFNVPVSAGQPTVADVIRYGIVPRVLDPKRPEISSARVINRIMAGSQTSSFNFLSIGTLYFFYGPLGIVVFYFVASIVFCLIVSRATRAGPIALCIMMVSASSLLGWASTFPDTIIGYLQSLISFVPILAVLLVLRRPEPDLSRRFD